MKSTLSKSIASYKQTPKLGKGDKISSKKKKRISNVIGILATPTGPKKILQSPVKKPSLKIIQSRKINEGFSHRHKGVRIWKITDVHQLCPPANFQYMNPASYGHAVNDADSSISYSSSENWYKRRAKFSKSSNRSSNRGNSAYWEGIDDGFVKDLFGKNEDIENHSTNIDHNRLNNLLALISNKWEDHTISKFSSHLNINPMANIEEIPENPYLVWSEENTERVQEKKRTAKSDVKE